MDDISILYKNNNYKKFIPKEDMTRVEQLNAMTRLCIYLIILMLIMDVDNFWLYMPIIGIVVIVLLNYLDKDNKKRKVKDFVKIMNNRVVKDQDVTENFSIDLSTFDSNSVDYTVDSKSLMTTNEIKDFAKSSCQKPTLNNPFMNPEILDYNTTLSAVACNSNDEDINDSMNIGFNHELFRNVDEIYERKNSQRQFYTMPNTAIPNNQTDFAEWLYKIPQTCKENQVNCLRYEDLRDKR